ncbi:hypothetical protein HK104_006033 [Borealophlyctis nickersoniae]|nr:hypothetical protein HK104_006033 [Borealophlyctis nickersoniae]
MYHEDGPEDDSRGGGRNGNAGDRDRSRSKSRSKSRERPSRPVAGGGAGGGAEATGYPDDRLGRQPDRARGRERQSVYAGGRSPSRPPQSERRQRDPSVPPPGRYPDDRQWRGEGEYGRGGDQRRAYDGYGAESDSGGHDPKGYGGRGQATSQGRAGGTTTSRGPSSYGNGKEGYSGNPEDYLRNFPPYGAAGGSSRMHPEGQTSEERGRWEHAGRADEARNRRVEMGAGTDYGADRALRNASSQETIVGDSVSSKWMDLLPVRPDRADRAERQGYGNERNPMGASNVAANRWQNPHTRGNGMEVPPDMQRSKSAASAVQPSSLRRDPSSTSLNGDRSKDMYARQQGNLPSQSSQWSMPTASGIPESYGQGPYGAGPNYGHTRSKSSASGVAPSIRSEVSRVTAATIPKTNADVAEMTDIKAWSIRLDDESQKGTGKRSKSRPKKKSGGGCQCLIL